VPGFSAARCSAGVQRRQVRHFMVSMAANAANQDTKPLKTMKWLAKTMK
jgi:hypothetical protein